MIEQKKIYPLSHPQKRIWYIEQIYPDTSLYNIGGTIRIKGCLNLNILKQAIFLTLSTNPGTRLRIIVKDSEPCQYICSETEKEFEVVDFSNEKKSEEKFYSWVKQEAETPFNLFDSQLYRIKIFKINKNDMGYLLNFHHIICDGFSTRLMTTQISDFYKKIISGQEYSPLEKDSYLDYFINEKKYLNSGRFTRNKLYWNEKFKTLPEMSANVSSDSISGQRKSYTVSELKTKQVKELIAHFGISLNTFYTGILLIYLDKITHLRDYVLGIPVLNRFGKKEKRTVGMFTSTMPFRIKLEDELNIVQFYKLIENEFGPCYFNQKYPYDLLAGDLKLRKKGYKTLFDIYINYYNLQHTTDFDGFAVLNENFYSGFQIYSLQLIIKEWLATDNISLDFDFKTGDYSETEIDGMYEYFNYIIDQISGNKNIELSDINLVTEKERRRKIINFNSTDLLYPADKTIQHLFYLQVLRSPDNVAVSFNDKKLTYKELNRKSNQLAFYIKEQLKISNRMVCISGSHSLEMIIGILGILKSGNVFVPLDLKLPPDRIKYILEETNPGGLLTNSDNFTGLHVDCPIVDLNNKDIYKVELDQAAQDESFSEAAYIIYTSGSTGKPKGVLVSQKSLVNYIWWAKKQYIRSQDDIFAFYSSISFDLTITSIFTPLISGARIRVYDPFIDGEFVLFRIFNENTATICKLTPSHLTLVKNRNNSNSNLRCLIVGGEDLTLDAAKDIYNSFDGQIEIFNEYGPTEATVGCMIYKYDHEGDTGISVPIGKPIDNSKIYLLDDKLEPVPAGNPGNMYISGDCLALGYYKNEKLTDQCFIENPYIKGAKMYKTGDVARFIDTDSLVYCGRIDNQVKIRGYRVELEEIEKSILTYDGIAQVFVNLVEVKNSKMLYAYVVKEKGIVESDIRNYLHTFLPDYMVPARIVFVDKFPLTQNGKIDKKKLPHPDNDDSHNHLKHEYAPKTDMETAFISIIKEVLELSHVYKDDNFYYLGGDSIKAIRISVKLSKLDYNISVKDLLNNPVISRMVDHVYQNKERKEISQDICAGKIEPTPIVNWFFSNNLKNRHYYNQSLLLELKNDTPVHVLQSVMNSIIHHHDSFRINFNSGENKLFYNPQHLDTDFEIQEYNLTGLSDDEQLSEIKRICIEARSSFNIESTLLLTGCLFRLSRNKRLFFLTFHHLVVDGVSLRIILDELKERLAAAEKSGKYTPALKTHSYQDWAKYLQSIDSAKFAGEVEFWNKMTEHNYVFKSNNTVKKEESARIFSEYRLSKETTLELLSGVNRIYGTKIDEILIIALAMSFQEISGEELIVLELESHGRSELFVDIDISNTIGWFTSLYPVVLGKINPDLNTAIKSLKEELRSIPGKGIGYGILKYILNPAKSFQDKKHIRFNFLGDFSSFENEYFKISTLSHGPESSPDNEMTSVFEMNAYILKNKLHFSVDSTTDIITIDGMDDFNRIYRANIKKIIDLCRTRSQCEFTPSDFEMIRLNQEELDSLFIKPSAGDLN